MWGLWDLGTAHRSSILAALLAAMRIALIRTVSFLVQRHSTPGQLSLCAKKHGHDWHYCRCQPVASSQGLWQANVCFEMWLESMEKIERHYSAPVVLYWGKHHPLVHTEYVTGLGLETPSWLLRSWLDRCLAVLQGDTPELLKPLLESFQEARCALQEEMAKARARLTLAARPFQWVINILLQSSTQIYIYIYKIYMVPSSVSLPPPPAPPMGWVPR